MRIRQHELLAGLTREVLGVIRVLVIAGEFEDVDEALQRLPIALAIVFDPGDLVERVAVYRVSLRWEFEHLAIELRCGVHVAVVEVVLCERQVGVRHEAAPWMVLDQSSVDRAGFLELVELLERKRQ